MKLQRQGHIECFPTTIAMLAGIDKDVLIQKALAHFGEISWTHLWHFSGKGERAAKFIVKEAGLSGHGLTDFIRTPPGLSPGASKTGIEVPEGKGLMDIGLIEGEEIIRQHSVAFEDGMVFDPEKSRPLTADEFNSLHPGWVLMRVARIEK